MKKDTDVLTWLREDKAPSIPEDRVNELISAGKRYMQRAQFGRSPVKNILSSQLQALPLSFWLLQAGLCMAIVLLICFFGFCGLPLREPLTALAVLIPGLVLLGVREIAKSDAYGMWEIEQSSRYRLTAILACRMLIVGGINLLCITCVVLVMNYYYRQSVIEWILYGMAPFHIACACCLFTATREERGHDQLVVCTVGLAAAFSAAVRQEALFKASMLWCWAVFDLVSAVLLGKVARRYLAHEGRMREWAWS